MTDDRESLAELAGNCSCSYAPCEHDAARDPSLKDRVKAARESPEPGAPVIVGESNPYGGDEHYALFPDPPGCSGERLKGYIMGLREETYLRSFERRNLLRGSKWSAPRAREAAAALVEKFPEPRVWVLLGRKVAAAFRLESAIDVPCVVKKATWRSGPANVVVLLPHPSGRNRAWKDAMLQARCRELLCRELPAIPFGETFRVDLVGS